ncbi:RHS domain-containing protein [Sneathiella sp.]
MNFFHPDHLGAPQKMTDADRNIVWDASFLPFGFKVIRLCFCS